MADYTEGLMSLMFKSMDPNVKLVDQMLAQQARNQEQALQRHIDKGCDTCRTALAATPGQTGGTTLCRVGAMLEQLDKRANGIS